MNFSTHVFDIWRGNRYDTFLSKDLDFIWLDAWDALSDMPLKRKIYSIVKEHVCKNCNDKITCEFVNHMTYDSIRFKMEYKVSRSNYFIISAITQQRKKYLKMNNPNIIGLEISCYVNTYNIRKYYEPDSDLYVKILSEVENYYVNKKIS